MGCGVGLGFYLQEVEAERTNKRGFYCHRVHERERELGSVL